MTCPRLVLIVDDDQDIRDTLGGVLTEEGYRVVGAANGQEALDYLKDGERPCLILLDLMMPVMDGWQFLKQQGMSPSLAEIPVVVITAAGAQRTAQLKASAVLAKP